MIFHSPSFNYAKRTACRGAQCKMLGCCPLRTFLAHMIVSLRNYAIFYKHWLRLLSFGLYWKDGEKWTGFRVLKLIPTNIIEMNTNITKFISPCYLISQPWSDNLQMALSDCDRSKKGCNLCLWNVQRTKKLHVTFSILNELAIKISKVNFATFSRSLQKYDKLRKGINKNGVEEHQILSR